MSRYIEYYNENHIVLAGRGIYGTCEDMQNISPDYAKEKYEDLINHNL